MGMHHQEEPLIQQKAMMMARVARCATLENGLREGEKKGISQKKDPRIEGLLVFYWGSRIPSTRNSIAPAAGLRWCAGV